ncbi:nucleotidyltransferase domain-containing protein [Sulfuricurvum sp.]|uniref:nucleotidyltransferase domain-containing protein n=1 Tax=Sulfuricurvum sp. TaxID=2025608 RepID=UPI003564C917
MRLTAFEHRSILTAFQEVFGEGDIYLFGSRVDDHKRGGDIDLYIETNNQAHLSEKKIRFLILLESLIGEQKIDVVFHRDNDRLIEKEAKIKGVQLNTDTAKIEKYFNECNKHILRIEQAYNGIKEFLPISASAYPHLSESQVQAIDQYLFRFAKLQDTMGDKLFKLILSQYEENTQQLSFIDILNKLEKLEFLPSAKEWLTLRKIRNEISHQYDDEPEEMSQAINTILNQKTIIIEIYEHIKNRYER